MSYTTIQNREGTESHTPKPRLWGLYDSGLVRQPFGESSAWAMATNGKASLTSALIVKESSIIAKSTSLRAYAWRDEESQLRIRIIEKLIFGTEDEVTAAMNAARKVFKDWELEILVDVASSNIRTQVPMFAGNSFSGPNGLPMELGDILTPSSVPPEDNGFVMNRDISGYLTLTGAKTGFMLAMNAVRQALTNIQRLKWPDPEALTVGLNLLRYERDKSQMRCIKYSGQTLQPEKLEEFMTLMYREEEYNPAQRKRQALYEGILSCMIERWVQIEGYKMTDYVCVAATYIAMTSSTGDIKLTSPLDANDIFMRLLDYATDGHSLAWRFNPDDKESIVGMFYFGLLSGMILESIQAQLQECSWIVSGRTHPAKIFADFSLFWPAQIEDVGSNSTPFMPMASTDIGNDFPFPGECKKGVIGKLVIQTQLNKIKPLMEEARVDIGGRVPGTAEDMKWHWVRYRVDEAGYWTPITKFTRELIQVAYPVWHLMMDKLTVSERRLLWFLHKFETQGSVLKDGYKMNPGLGILAGPTAEVIINRRYETEIIGKTQTENDPKSKQTPLPGAATSTSTPPTPAPNDQAAALAAASDNSPGSAAGSGSSSSPTGVAVPP